MAYKGKYKIKNPDKYLGNPSKVVFRSLWERNAFRWCETNPKVKLWNSEEVVVPYKYQVDKKLHRYYVDLLVQEYIKVDYDIRVLVLNGEVIASMKRNVISGDIRSNASLGAKTEKIELTQIEKETSIKVAELVDGDLVGVDLLPTKNREKDKPYILEVNGTPGLGGIEDIETGTVKKIFNHFKNRDNWR